MNQHLFGKARVFAIAAHEAIGQKRKYTGEPYYLHPLHVATIVSSFKGTDEMVIAALLHDTVEDTDITLDIIEQEFGATVAQLVDELTDKFVDPAIGNRAHRKALERDRLATISKEAQTIKLADLLHNTSSIVRYDPGFARVYLAEKRAILGVMTLGNEALRQAVLNQLVRCEAKLNVKPKAPCGCVYRLAEKSPELPGGLALSGQIVTPCPDHGLGHKRFQIISASDDSKHEVLESFDTPEEAELRLATLISDGDDCELYLVDIED